MMSQNQYAATGGERRRGRPLLGGIAGFFLGVFVWIDLILFGVMPLDSGVGYLMPILGVAAGIGMAMWAPFGGGASTDVPAAAPQDGPPPAPPTFS